MTKTIHKNISVIAGLFFLAQSTMAPAALAANIGYSHPIYWQAATSADPIIFGNQKITAFAELIVADNIEAGSTVAKVVDNSEPTVQEVKDYVLNEVKKAGLNVREAEALVFCESRWDYQAVNDKNRNGSNDKGLWQINSIHKDITDAEKLDYKASTKWAIAKRLKDGNWSAWACSVKRVAKTAETAVWE